MHKSANISQRQHHGLSTTEYEELSITSEIDLVVETEDIKDELHILKAVLTDQRQSMEQLEKFLHQARTKITYVNYTNDDANLVDYSCVDAQMHRILEMNELAERALSSVRYWIPRRQPRFDQSYTQVSPNLMRSDSF